MVTPLPSAPRVFFGLTYRSIWEGKSVTVPMTHDSSTVHQLTVHPRDPSSRVIALFLVDFLYQVQVAIYIRNY